MPKRATASNACSYSSCICPWVIPEIYIPFRLSMKVWTGLPFTISSQSSMIGCLRSSMFCSLFFSIVHSSIIWLFDSLVPSWVKQPG